MLRGREALENNGRLELRCRRRWSDAAIIGMEMEL